MRIMRAEPLRHRHAWDEHIGFVDGFFLKREHDRPNFNRRMFDEDFGRLFRSKTRNSESLLDIESNDEPLTQKLLANLGTKYAASSVDRGVPRWVEEIAQYLIHFGRAYYFLHDASEHGEIQVTPFGSDGVVRIFGKYFQWLPKRTGRQWDRDDEVIPREIRVLDPDKIVHFAMPRSIHRMLSAQNRTLTVLDQHQFEPTGLNSQATHENPNPTNHFDFRVWNAWQDRALYRSTRDTGWTGRKYDSSRRSDFFDCHRQIRFRRNQLVLRDDILRQISAELSRVGKCYNAEFAVKISGSEELPSVERLNRLEAQLSREEVGFTEVIDYCLKC